MEGYWRSKWRSNWKFLLVYRVGYQTLAFHTTNISKLFMIQIHSAFGLERPQWRDIGGQIESSSKHSMWGIKLLLLIPHTYLSYLWSKWILRLASNDLNGGILEVKMNVKLKVLVSISCGVSNSCSCTLYLASNDLNGEIFKTVAYVLCESASRLFLVVTPVAGKAVWDCTKTVLKCLYSFQNIFFHLLFE